jgi:hypothetical protein
MEWSPSGSLTTTWKGGRSSRDQHHDLTHGRERQEPQTSCQPATATRQWTWSHLTQPPLKATASRLRAQTVSSPTQFSVLRVGTSPSASVLYRKATTITHSGGFFLRGLGEAGVFHGVSWESGKKPGSQSSSPPLMTMYLRRDYMLDENISLSKSRSPMLLRDLQSVLAHLAWVVVPGGRGVLSPSRFPRCYCGCRDVLHVGSLSHGPALVGLSPWTRLAGFHLPTARTLPRHPTPPAAC